MLRIRSRSDVSLAAWQTPKFLLWTRFIVLFINLTFLFPYVAWAFDAPALPADRIQFNQRVVEIPRQLGSVAQAFQGQKGLVIHIQDLHCNYEVQNNIASLLDRLADSLNIRVVATEGASLPVNVRKLSTYPNAAVKREVGDYFMRAGRISGAEFYAATGARPIRLVGIENADHYRAARDGVMRFLTSETQGYLSDLRDLLEAQKERIYSPELTAFDTPRKRFRAGELPLLLYCRHLYASAEKAGLPAEDYSLAGRYLQQAVHPLPDLDLDLLYSELDQLDETLRQRLYRRPEQAQLDQLLHRLDVMEKMLNISASPNDVAEYRQHPDAFKVRCFADFLAGSGLESEVFELDRSLDQAAAFYGNADLRSADFIANLTNRMKEQGAEASILITGGYHTQQILDQLKARNISYLSVRPNLTHQDLVNPYFTLLRRQRSPLEKLLAQNQKILALEPFFAEWPDPQADPGEHALAADVRNSYRMLETVLKLDAVRRQLGRGATTLADLEQRYARELAGYTENGTLAPRFDQALLRTNEILLPFNGAFFARIARKGELSKDRTTAIQTMEIGDHVMAFYEQARWPEMAGRFQAQTRSQMAGRYAQAQVMQALVLGGPVVLEGAAAVAPAAGLKMSVTAGWADLKKTLASIRDRVAEMFQPAVTAPALGRFQETRAAAGGAMGRVRIESVKPLKSGLVQVVVQQLDASGRAAGETSELHLKIRPMSPGQSAKLSRTLSDLATLRDTKTDWYQDDHAILADILQHAEKMADTKPDMSFTRGLAGMFVVRNVQLVRGPPVNIFEGLGTPQAMFLSEKLFDAPEQVFQAALLHEAGESLDNPAINHPFLRGVGSRVREQKMTLTPEEEGFIGRVLGPEAQAALTAWLKSQKPPENIAAAPEKEKNQEGGSFHFIAGKKNAVDGKIVIAKVARYDGTPGAGAQAFRPIADADVDKEIDRLKKSQEKFRAELMDAMKKNARHDNVITDDMIKFTKCFQFENFYLPQMAEEIRKRKGDAADVIRQVIAEQADTIEDVSMREIFRFGELLATFMDSSKLQLPDVPQNEPFVLVIKNPNPYVMSELVETYKDRLKAVVWDGPYEPLHWVFIQAEAAGIPVLGDPSEAGVFGRIQNNDTIIVDADHRRIMVNPQPAVKEAYVVRQLAQQALEETYRAEVQAPAKALNAQRPVVVSAVVGAVPSMEEAETINQSADGIGLFRTEYLYTGKEPTEDELTRDFLITAERIQGMVSCRALDRKAGDKDKDAFEGEQKYGVDFLLDSPESRGGRAFRIQCKAMLRAYAHSSRKNIRLFVPMIRTAEQSAQAYAVLQTARAELMAEGTVTGEMLKGFQFGVMIETKEAVDDRARILTTPGIDFISIGTRDLSLLYNAKDQLSEDYLQAIRAVVESATRLHRDFSLCGEYAADRTVILAGLTWTDQLKLGLLPTHIPSRKAFIRHADLNHVNPGMTLPQYGRLAKAWEQETADITVNTEEYRSTLHRLYMQQGIRLALQLDFDRRLDEMLRDLTVVSVEPNNGFGDRSDIGRLGYDYSYLNMVGRFAVHALGYQGTNQNPVNIFLHRVNQLHWEKILLQNDEDETFDVIASEGARKGEAHMPEGTELGFGQDKVEVVSLDLEGAQGLINPRKTGTLVARAYAKSGAFTPLPDAYMFQAVVSPQLSSLDLTAILKKARKGQNLDQAKVALAMLQASRRQGLAAPRVGVLLRERHQELITTLLQSMGIRKTFSQVVADVQAGNGRTTLQGPLGTLTLFEDDDWSSGLSLGQPGGQDIVIGIGGTPEAQMSAILVKKLGGAFAGVLVPQNQDKFSIGEVKTFARYGLKDLGKIYTHDSLVKADPKDVACAIGVIRDYNLAGKNIPGPVLQPDGTVVTHTLWVAMGHALDVTLRYGTSVSRQLHLEAKHGEETKRDLEVALGYAQFGDYVQALSRLDKLSDQQQPAVVALRNYTEGLRLLAQDPRNPETVSLEAIAKWETAQSLLDQAGLAELEERLQLNRQIRRIYTWLRDEAARHYDWPKAVTYSEAAVKHSDFGFETLRRHHALHLQAMVDAYHRETELLWENKGGHEPDLEEKLNLAWHAFQLHFQDADIREYAARLRGQGTNLWTVFLYVSVLEEESLPDQAKILRMLNQDPQAKIWSAGMGEKFGRDILPRFQNLIQLAKQSGDFAYLQALGAKRPSLAARADLMLTRARLFIERNILSHRAQYILEELAEIAEAKADILPALGHSEKVKKYLEESIQHKEGIFFAKYFQGIRPAQIMWELAALRYRLFQLFGEDYRQPALLAYRELLDRDAFERRCAKTFTEDEAAGLWQIMRGSDGLRSKRQGQDWRQLAEARMRELEGASPVAEVVVRRDGRETVFQVAGKAPASQAGNAWTASEQEAWIAAFVEAVDNGLEPQWESLAQADTATRADVFLACLQKRPGDTAQMVDRFQLDLPNLEDKMQEMVHDFGGVLSWVTLAAGIPVDSPVFARMKAQGHELQVAWDTTLRLVRFLQKPSTDIEAETLQMMALNLARSSWPLELWAARIVEQELPNLKTEEDYRRLRQKFLLAAIAELSRQISRLAQSFEPLLNELQKPEIATAVSDAGLGADQLLAFFSDLIMVKQCLADRGLLDLPEPDQAMDLRLLYRLTESKLDQLSGRDLTEVKIQVEAGPGWTDQPHGAAGETGRILFFLMRNLITNSQRAILRKADALPAEERAAFLKQAAVRVVFSGNGLTITDEGDGISEAMAPKMFDRTVTEGRGTGLGLYSAFNIARKFGITLHYNSEIGKGTTVRVEFPEADVQAMAGAGQQEHALLEKLTAPGEPGSQIPRLISDLFTDSVRTPSAFLTYVKAPFGEKALLLGPAFGFIFASPLIGPVAGLAMALFWVVGFSAYIAFWRHKWVYTVGSPVASLSTPGQRVYIFTVFLVLGIGMLALFMILANAPAGQASFLAWLSQFRAFHLSMLWEAPLSYLIGALGHAFLNAPFLKNWMPFRPRLTAFQEPAVIHPTLPESADALAFLLALREKQGSGQRVRLNLTVRSPGQYEDLLALGFSPQENERQAQLGRLQENLASLNPNNIQSISPQAFHAGLQTNSRLEITLKHPLPLAQGNLSRLVLEIKSKKFLNARREGQAFNPREITQALQDRELVLSAWTFPIQMRREAASGDPEWQWILSESEWRAGREAEAQAKAETLARQQAEKAAIAAAREQSQRLAAEARSQAWRQALAALAKDFQSQPLVRQLPADPDLKALAQWAETNGYAVAFQGSQSLDFNRILERVSQLLSTLQDGRPWDERRLENFMRRLETLRQQAKRYTEVLGMFYRAHESIRRAMAGTLGAVMPDRLQEPFNRLVLYQVRLSVLFKQVNQVAAAAAGEHYLGMAERSHAAPEQLQLVRTDRDAQPAAIGPALDRMAASLQALAGYYQNASAKFPSLAATLGAEYRSLADEFAALRRGGDPQSMTPGMIAFFDRLSSAVAVDYNLFWMQKELRDEAAYQDLLRQLLADSGRLFDALGMRGVEMPVYFDVPGLTTALSTAALPEKTGVLLQLSLLQNLQSLVNAPLAKSLSDPALAYGSRALAKYLNQGSGSVFSRTGFTGHYTRFLAELEGLTAELRAARNLTLADYQQWIDRLENLRLQAWNYSQLLGGLEHGSEVNEALRRQGRQPVSDFDIPQPYQPTINQIILHQLQLMITVKNLTQSLYLIPSNPTIQASMIQKMLHRTLEQGRRPAVEKALKALDQSLRNVCEFYRHQTGPALNTTLGRTYEDFRKDAQTLTGRIGEPDFILQWSSLTDRLSCILTYDFHMPWADAQAKNSPAYNALMRDLLDRYQEALDAMGFQGSDIYSLAGLQRGTALPAASGPASPAEAPLTATKLVELSHGRLTEVSARLALSHYPAAMLTAFFRKLDAFETHLTRLAGRPVGLAEISFESKARQTNVPFMGIMPATKRLVIVVENQTDLLAQFDFELAHEFSHVLINAKEFAEPAMAVAFKREMQKNPALWYSQRNVNERILGSLVSQEGLNHPLFGRLRLEQFFTASVIRNLDEERLVTEVIELMADRASFFISDQPDYPSRFTAAFNQRIDSYQGMKENFNDPAFAATVARDLAVARAIRNPEAEAKLQAIAAGWDKDKQAAVENVAKPLERFWDGMGKSWEAAKTPGKPAGPVGAQGLSPATMHEEPSVKGRQPIFTLGAVWPVLGLVVSIAGLVSGSQAQWLGAAGGLLSVLGLGYFVFRVADLRDYFKTADKSYDINDLRQDLRKLLRFRSDLPEAWRPWIDGRSETVPADLERLELRTITASPLRLLLLGGRLAYYQAAASFFSASLGALAFHKNLLSLPEVQRLVTVNHELTHLLAWRSARQQGQTRTPLLTTLLQEISAAYSEWLLRRHLLSRERLQQAAQTYIDMISQGDDFLASPPDVFLVLGNPDFRTNVEFAAKWKAVRNHSGRDVPVVLAGGRGRGTQPLIQKTLEYYRNRLRLDAVEEGWLQDALDNPQVTEADVLAFILEKEGLPRSALSRESQPSKNTGENFKNSEAVVAEKIRGISHPRIAIVTYPPLLLRVLATSRGLWKTGIARGWEPLRFQAYPLMVRDFSDQALVDLVGYTAGYPQSFVRSFKKLNPWNELRGTQKENNPNVESMPLTPANWEALKRTQEAFADYLNTCRGEYDPDRNALVVAEGKLAGPNGWQRVPGLMPLVAGLRSLSARIRQYQEKQQWKRRDLFWIQIQDSLDPTGRRAYDRNKLVHMINAFFGREVAVDQLEERSFLEILDAWIRLPEKQRTEVLRAFTAAAENATYYGSQTQRVMPLAWAVANAFQGRNLLDPGSIGSLAAQVPDLTYLKDYYPLLANPKRVEPEWIPTARLEFPTLLRPLPQKRNYRWLDIGSGIKAQGAPTLRFLKQAFGSLLPGKRFAFYGDDIFFPRYAYRHGTIVKSRFQDRDFNDRGEARVNGITYLDANRPGNNVMDGAFMRDRDDRGRFDFLSLCKTMHYLGLPGESVVKGPLAYGVEWVNEHGRPFTPEYGLTPKQRDVVGRLLRQLEVGGLLFMEVANGVGFEGHRRSSNADAFLVIQRLDENRYCLYDHVVLYQPNLEFFESAPFFLRGFHRNNPVYDNDGIVNLYHHRSPQFYAGVERWLERADLLAYRWQARDRNVWPSAQAAVEAIRQGKPLDEIFARYLQHVPDSEPLKAKLLDGVRQTLLQQDFVFRTRPPVVNRFEPGTEVALAVSADGFLPSGASKTGSDRVHNQLMINGERKPMTPQNAASVAKKTVPELIADYRTNHPDMQVLAALPNGNLGLNDWFVGIADGRPYYGSQEPLQQRIYDMLVTRTDGTTSVERIKFFHEGREGIFDADGRDLSSSVRFGVYGQRIVKEGRLNLEAVYDQFDDLRHLLRFPLFQLPEKRQLHLGFNDDTGEMVHHREKVLQALQGKPVALSLQPLLDHGITVVEREEVFKRWGYRNVTGEEPAEKLAPGEYVVDEQHRTVTMAFLPGTHPHTLFGVAQDGRLLTAVVPGDTHFEGARLQELAQEMIRQGARDVFLWANGKDALQWDHFQHLRGPNNVRGSFLEAALIVKKIDGPEKLKTQPQNELQNLLQIADRELKTQDNLLRGVPRSEVSPDLKETMRMSDLPRHALAKMNGIAPDLRITEIVGMNREYAADFSLADPHLQEKLDFYIEKPAQNLMVKILRAGGKPRWSNAFGSIQYGVEWTKDGVDYFTPLTLNDYQEAYPTSAPATPQEPAGAMGKIRIEQVVPLDSGRLVVRGQRLTGEPIDLLIQYRSLTPEEKQRIDQAVAAMQAAQSRPQPVWQTGDPARLAQVIGKAEELRQAPGLAESLQGIYAIISVQEISNAEETVFEAGRGLPEGLVLKDTDAAPEGLGLADAVLLDETMLQEATQAVMNAGFMHETGESTRDERLNHRSLRGLGKQERQAKGELIPEDMGLVGRIFGPAQDQLTSYLSDRKTERAADRIVDVRLDLSDPDHQDLKASLEEMAVHAEASGQRLRVEVIAPTAVKYAMAEEWGFDADRNQRVAELNHLQQQLLGLSRSMVENVSWPQAEHRVGGRITLTFREPLESAGSTLNRVVLIIWNSAAIRQANDLNAIWQGLADKTITVHPDSLPVVMRLNARDRALGSWMVTEDEAQALRQQASASRQRRQEARAAELRQAQRTTAAPTAPANAEAQATPAAGGKSETVDAKNVKDPERRKSLQALLLQAWSEESLVNLDAADGEVFAVFLGNRAVGFIQTQTMNSLGARCAMLYVDPAFRSRGIGTRLLFTALAYWKAQGCANYLVDSVARSQAAQDFHARMIASLGGAAEILEINFDGGIASYDVDLRKISQDLMTRLVGSDSMVPALARAGAQTPPTAGVQAHANFINLETAGRITIMEEHDRILPLLQEIAQRGPPAVVINFDAHLDSWGRVPEGRWINDAKDAGIADMVITCPRQPHWSQSEAAIIAAVREARLRGAPVVLSFCLDYFSLGNRVPAGPDLQPSHLTIPEARQELARILALFEKMGVAPEYLAIARSTKYLNPQADARYVADLEQCIRQDIGKKIAVAPEAGSPAAWPWMVSLLRVVYGKVLKKPVTDDDLVLKLAPQAESTLFGIFWLAASVGVWLALPQVGFDLVIRGLFGQALFSALATYLASNLLFGLAHHEVLVYADGQWVSKPADFKTQMALALVGNRIHLPYLLGLATILPLGFGWANPASWLGYAGILLALSGISRGLLSAGLTAVIFGQRLNPVFRFNRSGGWRHEPLTGRTAFSAFWNAVKNGHWRYVVGLAAIVPLAFGWLDVPSWLGYAGLLLAYTVLGRSVLSLSVVMHQRQNIWAQMTGKPAATIRPVSPVAPVQWQPMQRPENPGNGNESKKQPRENPGEKYEVSPEMQLLERLLAPETREQALSELRNLADGQDRVIQGLAGMVGTAGYRRDHRLAALAVLGKLAREAANAAVLAALQACRTDSDEELRNQARQTTRLVFGESEGKTTLTYLLKSRLQPRLRYLDLRSVADERFASDLSRLLRRGGFQPSASASINPTETSLADAGFPAHSADLVTLDRLADAGFLENAMQALNDNGLLMVTFDRSATAAFTEGVIERIRQVLESDPTRDYDFYEMRVPEGYPNPVDLADHLLLVKKHPAPTTRHGGQPGGLSVYQKALAEEGRIAKPGRFEYGRSASDPANPLLQIWRFPRFLGMLVLSAVFDILDRMAKALGEKASPADAAVSLAYIKYYETRFFPANSVEAKADASRLVQAGVFEKGGLAEQALGRFQIQEDRPGLSLDQSLVQAALHADQAEEKGGLATVSRLRAWSARNLIRQIYYYRSAEYYGLTLGGRLRSLFGNTAFSNRRADQGKILLAEFLTASQGEDRAAGLQALADYSNRIRSLGVPLEFMPVQYNGSEMNGQGITTVAVARSAAPHVWGLLIERLERLNFTVDEKNRQRFLPQPSRESPLRAA